MLKKGNKKVVENNFKESVLSLDRTCAKRLALKILQVNLGNKCNQKCVHCHVGASPEGNLVMPQEVIGDILKFLSRKKGLILDITGGAPELNPNFRYLIEQATLLARQIMVRTNLTVLFEDGMEVLPEFYKKHGIKLIGSLPCYTEDNVNKQRGSGAFAKSIKALKILNQHGYGKELPLDLVYNPGGAFLPSNRDELEKEYKKKLQADFGVIFNRLLTITNVPLARFEEYLKTNGQFDEYMEVLINHFNKDTVPHVMCRNLLSVGWDGQVYDCDFNQALGLSFKNERGECIKLRDLDLQDLGGREIIFQNYCYACTAGEGSSCTGALTS